MKECVTHHHACRCREAMFARAVEIADDTMRGVLFGACLPAGESGNRWHLVDFTCNRVATLAEAEPALIEAVQWLQERGLCELIESPDGATVNLREEQCCN